MVAVFGSIQMAVSRVINLQHHRIAQVGTRDPLWCHKAFGAPAEPGAVWLSWAPGWLWHSAGRLFSPSTAAEASGTVPAMMPTPCCLPHSAAW